MTARIIWHVDYSDEKKMMKFILILCGVALGSTSHVMAEDLDIETDDLIDVPGVSVSLGGEAVMGLGRHSTKYSILPQSLRSSYDHDYLIREYEVTFSSSGVTDGGLMFGASISFDEGAAGTKVSDDLAPPTSPMPGEEGTATINGYVVEQYIWVQEGSGTATNALAEFDFDGDDADSEAAVSVIADDFQAKVDAWNADAANVDAQLHRVKVTFDTAGVATYTDNDDDLDGGSEDTPNTITVAAASITRAKTEIVVPADADTDTDTNTHEVRNGIGNASVYVGAADGSWKLQFGGNDPGMEASGYFGYPSANDLVYPGNEDTTIGIYGEFLNTTFRITRSDPGADENLWSAGVNYAGEKIEVGLGMDNEASLIFVIGYKFPGVEAKYFYGKYDSFGVKHFSYDNHLDRYDGKDFGVQAIIDLGYRSTLTTSYSTREVNGQTVDEDGFALPGKVLFHSDAKLTEVDFAHDLGGGITFKTELSQVDALTTLFEHGGPPLYSIKDTYLEMLLEMKF